MKIYLESLGCRLNAAEIESLARQFAGVGCEVIMQPETADIIILNTCAVTAQASRKSRHRLRTLARRSPQAKLAVIGCWGTELPHVAAQLPSVHWVIPNVDKFRAVEIVTGCVPSDKKQVAWEPGRWGHTRAFVGVQDGCDHHCTYCITRVLRGRGRSLPLVQAVEAVQERVARGAQEVVLTGVSLGAYGQDLGLENGLAQLVAAILQDTELPRLRLSSVEPWDVDENLLSLWENPRLCRQLHLPLQAGTDLVLRRMGRRITTAEFAHLVDFAREVSPAIALTTDLIVGFPGETADDFTASMVFVERMAFARLHVFPYSEREGTAALRLPGAVSPIVRKERAARMRDLGERLSRLYHTRFMGQVLPVLWERRDRAGRWRGLTDNYLDIATKTPVIADLYNHITPTRLLSQERSLIYGEVVTSP
ncbi:MAG: tRNA (N(6)-L-threonylcarbamoyladenosine(37)-C(2))-methylthiotransferase MtaB [Anaerolineae bacterium]|nr:tRNA (N(6)-L-threonylcarbamoyladenosine(37)-C(2))-methylthiotransferase MtaB [Anaerolineae bacterium]